MQKFYADAFFHRPPIVMGLQLQPLSLGHALILYTVASPCILLPADRPPLNFDQALPGIWICSKPWTDVRLSMVSGTWKEELGNWAKTLKEPLSAAEIDGPEKWKGGALESLVNDLQLFEKYLSVYVQIPPSGEVMKDGKLVEGRPCHVPWPLSVTWRLMERMEKETVLALPLPEAFAWHACARDAAGDESLLSEDEDENCRQTSSSSEPLNEEKEPL